MSEEEVSKDLESRLDALDTRETLLQKKVATLEERVAWILKEKDKRDVKGRWKWGIVIGMLISLINMILNFLGVC